MSQYLISHHYITSRIVGNKYFKLIPIAIRIEIARVLYLCNTHYYTVYTVSINVQCARIYFHAVQRGPLYQTVIILHLELLFLTNQTPPTQHVLEQFEYLRI